MLASFGCISNMFYHHPWSQPLWRHSHFTPVLYLQTYFKILNRPRPASRERGPLVGLTSRTAMTIQMTTSCSAQISRVLTEEETQGRSLKLILRVDQVTALRPSRTAEMIRLPWRQVIRQREQKAILLEPDSDKEQSHQWTDLFFIDECFFIWEITVEIRWLPRSASR